MVESCFSRAFSNMILLDVNNKIVEETLKAKIEFALEEKTAKPFFVAVADFDGVFYRISNTNCGKEKINVSISLTFYDELISHGVNDILLREYGKWLLETPEDGYNVTLQLSIVKGDIPDDWEAIVAKFGLLKRNCFASVFEKYFALQEAGWDGQESAVVHYRDDETMYVEATHDRVTVIFSTTFKDKDDIILGKVFLREFIEGKRKHDSAPHILYNRDPPAGIEEEGALTGENVRYITFVLCNRHTNEKARQNTIDLIHQFRNYLHYHIKCSKAYLHSRMRTKTNNFLKVLNRAKADNKIPAVLRTDSSKELTKMLSP